jgi:acetyltransferase-like isoleucine patch superfamily enzyme
MNDPASPPGSARLPTLRAAELGVLAFGAHTCGEPGVMLYTGDTANGLGNHLPATYCPAAAWSAGRRHPATKGNIVVGSDVWIGAKARVLSGMTIGDGAVVGTGAVVASDVRPCAIVVGNPARE